MQNYQTESNCKIYGGNKLIGSYMYIYIKSLTISFVPSHCFSEQVITLVVKTWVSSGLPLDFAYSCVYCNLYLQLHLFHYFLMYFIADSSLSSCINSLILARSCLLFLVAFLNSKQWIKWKHLYLANKLKITNTTDEEYQASVNAWKKSNLQLLKTFLNRIIL